MHPAWKLSRVVLILSLLWITHDYCRVRDNEDAVDSENVVVILEVPEKYVPSILGTVDSRYVSFTLDWWPPDQGSPFPPPSGWGQHANVLNVDLQSNILRTLARALQPSFLRIGGTLDKIVAYEIPHLGATCEAPSTASNPPPCLNMSRWKELHFFADATHSKIVFGLSYPTAGNNASEGVWNASQATALFRYSQQHGFNRRTTLHGFELGEELEGYQVGSTAFDNYISAYRECAKLLREIYCGDAKSDCPERPLLMGPCPGMAWPTLATWFPAFLHATRSLLDVAVYHSYNQVSWNELYLNFTIPSGNLSTQKGLSPGDTGWQAVAIQQFVHHITPTTPLWLGEMGPHNGGGGPGNISRSFASSFSYMDTLGQLARLNHQVLSRQTLVGGKYELLRCSTGGQLGCDFEPHPDFYVALLWSRLMGRIVLRPPRFRTVVIGDSKWTNDLHFHLHCSNDHFQRGSITLAFSNKSTNSSYHLLLPEWGPSRIEYTLQACQTKNNPFVAKKVQLNGRCLHVGNHTTTSTTFVETLQGQKVSNGKSNLFKIRPSSLGFVAFPQASLARCVKP
ncbi:glycosyl hydrolase family 79 protein [Nitzschia inconspicua]|uniref:Glycosyl hydrolase family 79 protein n=1 Tax=Nitzschia inconspicua TaxID=303405 RepID=A0A9K3PSJ9_9STRA|nr:glycosyl hydrolase family 79 protein [Nitzschia inconspicua]